MDNTIRSRSYSSDIQDRVARIYYSHGLFCSSHPYSVITITLAIFILCCYPLIHLPLLGSSSQQFLTPVQGFVAPDIVLDSTENYKFSGPRWFQGPPVSYVQQIVVKSAVSPWKSDLILTDAFRAPLSAAFHINELINLHQISAGTTNNTSLSDLCLQVSEPIDKFASFVLPHYSCLVLSPSNIWKNDIYNFKDDPDIIKTIFKLKDSNLDASIIREILFGVPFKETGIKKLFVRNRPRIITYSFTIAFQSYNAKFIQSLSELIQEKFLANPYPENVTYSQEDSDIVHIQFQDLHTLVEFVPLVLAYVILFLYIYFSVCKIELVKSKWALAISAVMTVVMSLLMSVGLCLWFGLNPTLSGSEILPYLIVVIGLENMLVLTKSVVSTPMHLDVKLRVAQGLSKEGWSITKNLLTELALLMIAFLTFVPKIQEFCLFAVVGLLTDFFLQLVFFATFLSVDIRRMEITDLQRNCIREVASIRGNQSVKGNEQNMKNSTPRLMPIANGYRGPLKSTSSSAKIFAPPATPILVKLPKRMKFIYFWARTRMVQRGLMVCLVLWIFLLVYSSGIVEKYTGSSSLVSNQVINPLLSSISAKSNSSIPNVPQASENKQQWNCSEQIIKEFSRNIDLRLKHQNLNLWQSLPSQHWTTLFGYYNISLSGRFISILPPIHVSFAVDPKKAAELRNPNDAEISRKSYWQFLSSGEITDGDIDDLLSRDLSYHPSTPGEVALAIALVIPSLMFLIYLMVVLYRCMCSKHYAEWRTSWKNSSGSDSSRPMYSECSASDANLVMETFPLKLRGHSQELEYISADSNIIVSSCLDGNINVWDSISGECLTSIKRFSVPKQVSKVTRHSRNNGSFSSDSTYSSSPQSDTGEFMNGHQMGCNASHPKSPLKSEGFPKVFDFDKNYHFPNSCMGPSQKYDFSKFAVSKDSTSNNTLSEDTDNHSHEYQLRRDSSFDINETGTKIVHSTLSPQAVWSTDHYGSCIAVGCREGRVEIWNAFTGSLEYVNEENKSGVTALCLTENRLVAARVNGCLEFFALNIFFNENNSAEEQYTGRPSIDSTAGETIHCSWLQNVKAHSLAISALEVDGGLVVSGGYDRLIKVFKTDSSVCIYTLHGHTAPISVLNIDQFSPSSAASGCQDGLICLWDLMTGTCIYSLNGHQGAVITLLSTDIYMISQGTDSRICIWEKCQGHLLHNIIQDFSLHCNLLLLTNNIMVTTKEDNLVLWDVNHGEALRMIMVGSGDHSVHIRLLRLSGQSVVCDYGPQIFIINFPAISDKSD